MFSGSRWHVIYYGRTNNTTRYPNMRNRSHYIRFTIIEQFDNADEKVYKT